MATDASKTRGHDTVLDVTGEQLAKVYAQAFLAAAGKSDTSSSAVEELNAVVDEVIQAHPQFREMLQSAFISHEERVAVLDRVLGGRVEPVVLNTLKVMSAHNRLGLLRSVARQSKDLFDRESGLVPVQVRSAAPLSDEMHSLLESTLRSRLGIDPVIETAVDPEMLAGLKIRIGDTVYDGSLQTVFAKARQSIIDRAIEKLETAPDLFVAEETTLFPDSPEGSNSTNHEPGEPEIGEPPAQ